MIKSESTEKKLKEAIQKKKEELQKEKKLRQDKQQNEKCINKKNIESTNKLEKDMRGIMKENNDLKEENKILKNRVTEMLNKEINQGGNRPSFGNSNLNSSVAIPLNSVLNNSTIKNEAEQGKNKNNGSNLIKDKLHGKTLDNRAPSLKWIPNLLEILSQERHLKKSPKVSCKSLNKSSFLFGERKHSWSQDNIIGEHDSGSFKYWETWKYKLWREKLKLYDAQDLIANRDIIRSIRCIIWEKQYETSFFISHCKDWRLTHGVPSFLDEKFKISGKIELLSCDHFDNSLSSSPKNLFDESRYFSQNKEIEFSPDDIVSRSPDLAYENSKNLHTKERKGKELCTLYFNEQDKIFLLKWIIR